MNLTPVPTAALGYPTPVDRSVRSAHPALVRWQGWPVHTAGALPDDGLVPVPVREWSSLADTPARPGRTSLVSSRSSLVREAVAPQRDALVPARVPRYPARAETGVRPA